MMRRLPLVVAVLCATARVGAARAALSEKAGCRDDPTWHKHGEPTLDCRSVSSTRHCSGWKSSAGIVASVACPGRCRAGCGARRRLEDYDDYSTDDYSTDDY